MSQFKSGGNTVKGPATDRDKIDLDRYKAADCHIGLAVLVLQGHPMRTVTATSMIVAWRNRITAKAAARMPEIETIRHDTCR